jgi:hypothetical protein
MSPIGTEQKSCDVRDLTALRGEADIRRNRRDRYHRRPVAVGLRTSRPRLINQYSRR